MHVAGIMESKWEEDTPRPGFDCQTKIVGSKFLEVTGRLARRHGLISKRLPDECAGVADNSLPQLGLSEEQRQDAAWKKGSCVNSAIRFWRGQS